MPAILSLIHFSTSFAFASSEPPLLSWRIQHCALASCRSSRGAGASSAAAAGAVVSLHLVEVADPRAYGCVPTDTDGRVTAFLEKSAAPVTHQINAGCYVFDRSVVAAVPAGRVVSLERETFPGLLAAGSRVVGFLSGGYWADVGTPAALVQPISPALTPRARSPLSR